MGNYNKTLDITVKVHPDLSLLKHFAFKTYWSAYQHDPQTSRMTEDVGLTFEQLLKYLHDTMMIRCYQVSDATTHGDTWRKNFGFSRNLNLPAGYGPFVLNRIGISSLALEANYLVHPVVPKNYEPDDYSETLGDVENLKVDNPLPGCYLDKATLCSISDKLSLLSHIVYCADCQFSKKVTTNKEAIFCYMKQVDGSDCEVHQMHGHEMDDNELKVAAIVGFTPAVNGYSVLYPNFNLVNTATLGDIFRVKDDGHVPEDYD